MFNDDDKSKNALIPIIRRLINRLRIPLPRVWTSIRMMLLDGNKYDAGFWKEVVN